MNNQNESGRSMIEMLGVLGIMGVIMYAAVSGINFGIDIYRINAVHSEVEELSKAIIDFGSFSGGYSFLSKQNPDIGTYFCEKHIFPSCESGSMVNKWGGSVTVAPHNSGKGFEIKYSGIPKVSCKRLVEDMLFEYMRISDPDASSKCGSVNDIVFTSAPPPVQNP